MKRRLYNILERLLLFSHGERRAILLISAIVIFITVITRVVRNSRAAQDIEPTVYNDSISTTKDIEKETDINQINKIINNESW